MKNRTIKNRPRYIVPYFYSLLLYSEHLFMNRTDVLPQDLVKSRRREMGFKLFQSL